MALACSLFGHPHSFIDNSNIVTIGEQGVIQIQAKWIFDEMFTEMMLMDYDRDMNGFFDSSEAEFLYNEAFINTKDFNYFLEVSVDKQKIFFDKASHFTVDMIDDRLIYYFSLDVPKSGNTHTQEIILSTYDPTYYIMIDTDLKHGVELNAPDNLTVEIKGYERSIEFDMYGELPVPTFKIIIRDSDE